MGKSEIESWIASTSTSDDFDTFPKPTSPEWRRDQVFTDWPRALQIALKRLLSSSTKLRTQFLREELLILAKHGGELKLSRR